MGRAVGIGAVALLLLGTAAFMMKGDTTSMIQHFEDDLKNDHFEGILGRAEVLVNDTLQPRKLGGLSQACNAALKDQKKSMMKKAADLIVEEEYACTKTTMTSLKCKQVQQQKKAFGQTLKQECKANGDICKVKEYENGVSDEEEICMPQECHKHSEYIGGVFTYYRNKKKKCDGCVVKVSCVYS